VLLKLRNRNWFAMMAWSSFGRDWSSLVGGCDPARLLSGSIKKEQLVCHGEWSSGIISACGDWNLRLREQYTVVDFF
jgi:hypothetical protein